MSTRRIWDGTSPLNVTLDIKFVAVHANRIREEVIEPCTRLQQIAVPNVIPVIGVAQPPGPGIAYGGDRIDIYIGKFLKFSQVIVSAVNVAYDNKFDSSGNPLSASCTLEFSTYEMINKTELEKITSVENLTSNFPQGNIQSLKENQDTAAKL
jgi:hypothetical protein